MNHITLDAEAELLELLFHEAFGNIVSAEEGIDPLGIELDDALFMIRVVHIDDTIHNIASIQ